jgi:hypothetical protein
LNEKKIRRQEDKYPMEIAIQEGFSLHTLNQIKNSRNYMRAITIEDITDELGENFR